MVAARLATNFQGARKAEGEETSRYHAQRAQGSSARAAEATHERSKSEAFGIESIQRNFGIKGVDKVEGFGLEN